MQIDVKSIEILRQLDEQTKKARQELRKIQQLLEVLDKTGYRTVTDLVEALKPIEGKEEEFRTLCKQHLTAAGVSTVPVGDQGKGKRLSDEQRAQITQMLKDGGKAVQVAEFFGVSPATVNKIKADAGLVRAKK